MSLRLIFFLLLWIGGASTIIARELVPLSQMDTGKIEESYAFVRCAALHRANLSWAGAERLGAETAMRMESQIDQLLEIAAKIRLRNSGATSENVGSVLLRDTIRIVEIYLERFEENYAMTGEAMASDHIWKSDLEFCTAVGELMATWR